jgi:nucleotide-binding universal stress UspA family protein
MTASQRSESMRVGRILCPVDQSECSGKALRYAAALAASHGAALDVVTVIVNVIPPPVPELAMMPILISDELRAAAVEALKDFVKTCGATQATSKVVEAPSPVTGIIEYAHEKRPDLLVLGTHGWRGFDRLVFGSTTERVLHSAPCPVLTIPPSGREVAAGEALRWSRILCPYDFSPASARALELGRSFAEEQHGRVTLLHVLEMLSPEEALTVAHYEVAEYVALRQQDVRKQLKSVLPDPAGTWRDPCDRVELGSASKTILRVAQEMNADLIVMGAHGHGTLGAMLLGSTTHTVVRRATCPVLTVRA